MGNFLKLIVVIGVLWALDVGVNDGRYSSALWKQASYQGQSVQYEIQDWFRQIGI